MLPIYNKLFNLIFDIGIVPDAWTIGNIIPIYENKGSKMMSKIIDQLLYLVVSVNYLPLYYVKY